MGILTLLLVIIMFFYLKNQIDKNKEQYDETIRIVDEKISDEQARNRGHNFSGQMALANELAKRQKK